MKGAALAKAMRRRYILRRLSLPKNDGKAINSAQSAYRENVPLAVDGLSAKSSFHLFALIRHCRFDAPIQPGSTRR
jgi:hypothetical protein